MPQSAPPSFIPHDAKQSRGRTQGQAGLAELLLLLSIVLVVTSVALAGGVFLYQQYLASSNASKLDQLKRAEAAFEPALVKQLQRLDDRMNAAEQILQAHLAPLELFNILERTTISKVQFTTLQFDATDPQRISLHMTGIADSVNSIALQSDLFTKSGAIQSPIFSNISRQSGGVSFDFTGFVDPSALNYESLITGQTQTTQVPIGSSTPSTSPAAQNAAPVTNPNPFNASNASTSAAGATQ